MSNIQKFTYRMSQNIINPSKLILQFLQMQHFIFMNEKKKCLKKKKKKLKARNLVVILPFSFNSKKNFCLQFNFKISLKFEQRKRFHRLFFLIGTRFLTKKKYFGFLSLKIF